MDNSKNDKLAVFSINIEIFLTKHRDLMDNLIKNKTHYMCTILLNSLIMSLDVVAYSANR